MAGGRWRKMNLGEGETAARAEEERGGEGFRENVG